MNKILYIGIILLSSFLLSLSTLAASEAKYGKVSKSWTLNLDGSQEYRHSMELTLFTHTAMNSTYGESFIVYNPQYQELKIHESYTRQKDGSIVRTPDNAFVEVLPRFAADAPAFNHLKEMVVVHTGLELGATIILDYSILTKAGYYPALDINARMQETSPVKVYEVSVSVPGETALNEHLYGKGAKVSKGDSNGMKWFKYTLRDVPASSREAFLPQDQEGSPRLVASTYSTGKEALDILGKRFKEAKNYESLAFAEYLTEKCTTDKEKLTLIQEHVIKNMGVCAVPMTETGYTIRDLDDVLRSAYGTLAEKTLLLNTLLNATGISSEIVAVYPGFIDMGTCGLSTIKNLAVKAVIDNKDCYLSATSLSPSTLTARGELDQVISLAGTPERVLAIPSVIKESKSVSVSADQAKDGFIACTLPAISSGLDSWNMTALNSKRTGDFELPALLDEEVSYTVTANQALKLQTPLIERTLSNPFGKVTRTIIPKGDTYEVTRSIKLNKQRFTASEYGQVRKLINEWLNPDNRVLLFSTF